MNSLIGEHGVFRGGREVGIVTAAEEGLMTVIACACEMLGGGVLRLAGVSGDEFVSLGVAMPESGRLRFRKSYTKSALAALKLDEHTSFYLILPGETLRELKDAPAADSMQEQADGGTDGGARATPVVKMTLGARDKPPDEEPPNIPDAKEAPAPPVIERSDTHAAMPELSEPTPPPDISGGNNAAPPELPHKDQPPVMPVATERERVPDIPDWSELEAAEERWPSDKPPPAAPRDIGPWKPIRDPASLFSDGDIAGACKNARGALTAERDGFTMLAIPAGADEPFPMMPVFCFGTSETIGGAEYIVFKTKNGNLAV